MRNHTDGREEVGNAAQFHGKCNTKCHSSHHQQRVDGTDNTYLNIIVEHIIDEIDQWNTGDDEQRTRQ